MPAPGYFKDFGAILSSRNASWRGYGETWRKRRKRLIKLNRLNRLHGYMVTLRYMGQMEEFAAENFEP
ncbi:MAG: hypothetical protein C5B50_09330 [Verrucomicrobia bacterium]|nr:MAG: hypothetical protein C5B50_09330 [Verrucomicrobiota bacterium]